MADRIRVLFVCLGNIVRSPLAENLFRKVTLDRGCSDRFDIDSAGTCGFHVGSRPDERMRAVARERGFTIDGRARQFEAEDFDRFDRILVMDLENRSNVLALASDDAAAAKVCLLRSYDDQAEGPDAEVPDPYYGGRAGFERAFDMVERSCRRLCEELLRGAG